MKPAYLPRLGDWIFISILLAGLLLGQRMLNLDSDLGRHLTLGRYILESGTIPTRNLLSFTLANEPRPAYEWLSQVAFALAERTMGLDGTVLLTSVVIGAAFLIVFLDARSRGGGPVMSLVLVMWAAVASSLHWLTRPHVFSFLFMAIWLYLLDRLRRGERRATWLLAIVMLLWANSHGGFIFGFVSLFAYALGWIIQTSRARPAPGEGARLLLASAGAFGASILTPGFGAGWFAVLRNTSPYVLSRTAETLPVSLATPGTWAFLALVILTIFLATTTDRQRLTEHVVLLVLMGVMAIAIMRNIPLFCVAAVPILATWAGESLQGETAFGRLEGRMEVIDSSARSCVWAPSAMLIACAILVSRHIKAAPEFYSFDPRRFPVAAADWILMRGLRPPVFNDLNWGGYLLYRLWPQEQVFIDSQTDFYGEAFVREYEATYQATDALETELDRFEIASVVLPSGAPLTDRLSRSPNWSVRYRDTITVIMERTVH